MSVVSAAVDRPPIVDTHLHFWEPPSAERPHSAEGMDIGPPVAVEQLLQVTSEAGVDRVVQVTPSCMGTDNRYALEGAERYPERICVFGRMDPGSPDVVRQLRGWEAHPQTVGIRLTLHRHAGGWASDPTWASFWRTCEKLGVAVAIYAPDASAEIGAVAAAHPDLAVIVDHCSLGLGPHPFAHWDELLRLERHPNVVLKVSRFPEAAASDGYPFVVAQGYVKELYERFGAERMMWGSNFPPVLDACSYVEALAFIRDECDFFTRDDRAAVLGGTARRVLRLRDEPPATDAHVAAQRA